MDSAARGRRLTVRQAAEHLGFSVATVYRLVADKQLPHYRIGPVRNGARLWFYERELDAWLDAQRVPAAGLRTRRAPRPTGDRPLGIEDLLPRERVLA